MVWFGIRDYDWTFAEHLSEYHLTNLKVDRTPLRNYELQTRFIKPKDSGRIVLTALKLNLNYGPIACEGHRMSRRLTNEIANFFAVSYYFILCHFLN